VEECSNAIAPQRLSFIEDECCGLKGDRSKQNSKTTMTAIGE
jgi:hypothetical protein